MYYKVAIDKGEDYYVSAMTEGRWQLRYRMNEETTAKIGGIYLFSSMSDVRTFIDVLKGFRHARFRGRPKDAGKIVVLGVEALKTWVPDAICYSSDSEFLNDFYYSQMVGNYDYRYLVTQSPWESLILAGKVIPRQVINLDDGE